MHNAKAIKSTIVHGTVVTATVALLAFAMLAVATPNAMATPALAKGQPCTACHAGSPPTAANLNDNGKKVQSGLKK
jgi:hypothetical protein